ncbi:MAG: amidohydrolase [Sphingomonas sp.]|nr:MAG: amidohydrolase [Sphingomonas sp.]
MFAASRRSILTLVAALLLPAGAAFAQTAPRADPAPLADHHMHIQSNLITAYLKAMNSKMPEAFKGISDDIFQQRTGADAIAQLNRAGIRQGVILSAGYMFAFAPMAVPADEMATSMRAENQFNVDAALASDGRLIAFIGLNPFAPNALDELNYWAGRKGASGVKLHLGNSMFDAGNPEQVAKLAAFFAAAREARMPLVIHLRSGAPFSGAKVQVFIDQVLSKAGDLPVQIAHGGGFGGVDQATLDALDAYGKAIANKAPGTSNLVLDLSAVAQLDLSALPMKDPAETRSQSELRKLYVDKMRRIGLDRFVLASDWPALAPPAEYFAKEQEVLPVTPAEWRQLTRNLAPYLRTDWAGPTK